MLLLHVNSVRKPNRKRKTDRCEKFVKLSIFSFHVVTSYKHIITLFIINSIYLVITKYLMLK